MRRSEETRAEFIDFFRRRGHTFVPSAPVIPHGDPTLLFVNAGMVQFKDVFLGNGTRDYRRAVNSQKCIRVSGKHNDLEVVGRDTYHHTFFEMLGNWSFGDYGKIESIRWAWELLTEVWKLPKDRLYATVHLEDDEAEALWKSETDLPADRIFRFGKDNFWEMGEVGPCGPSSEIHIDLGETPGGPSLAGDPNVGVNSGSARFIELWNLVFIRFERQADGSLTPLRHQHVDTGMGFERICSVLQGKTSNFETDLFQPLLAAVSELSGIDYQPGEAGTPHRVIADHLRMLSFAIADGVIPANEGRGYVARRILRRAARFGRELGVRQPFLYRLVSPLADLMGGAYPELVQRAQHVAQVLKAEEESFGTTLDRGIELFGEVARGAAVRGTGRIPGEDAFKLFDTYGFPLDLTMLMAREQGLEVDEEGFRAAMQRQRELSRAEGRLGRQGAAARWGSRLEEGARCEFTGYEGTEGEARVLGADEDSLLLDRTPFYPEGGGQVSDTGLVRGAGFAFRVERAERSGALIVHEGEWVEGGPGAAPAGAVARAEVEERRRLATARNHTATHLLHRVLLQELGDNATQAGSLVSPEALRFDFHHYEKLAEELVERIELAVNAEIRADRRVITTIRSYEEAVAAGAMALFGEKYESRVRVVEVEGFSRELCGGTHVQATGQLGAFVILSESSVAAGVRRIEALTGERATEYLLGRSRIVLDLERAFSLRQEDLLERMLALAESGKALSRELAQARAESHRSRMDELIAAGEKLPGEVLAVSRKVEVADAGELKGLGDSFREKAQRGVALFAAELDGKLLFVCAVTDDLVAEGRLKAGELVGQVAKLAGGGGGGKPHLATAGGRQPEKLAEVLNGFGTIVRERLGQ